MTSDSERPALQLDIDTLVGDGVRARTMAALFGEDDASPTSIGAYQIHGVIGRGGMGVVYRATDAALNRTVAIKRVLPERANPGRDDRLLEEARQLARIQHPNVVEVFEVGEHKGSPYLVLEYVPGPSLQQWLTTEEHTPQQVYAMFLQAGRGLAAAHARDVVHLDFKPANVLVAPGPTAKVADFGLAQLFARDTTRCASETGTDLTLSRAAGTPAYMAPEQFRGRVSAKADQFAFAVSMLQALSGHHPLEGAVAASLEPQEAAARLRSVRCKGTPRHAVAALRRACAHDPEQRWPSLAALLDVLEARSHRDWRTAAVFASSVLTAGLLAWFAGGSVRPPSCVELSEEAAQAWGSAARDQVVEALRSADAPGPSAGQGFILAQLDAAAESWAEQRRDACEAMRAGGGLDDATLDRRFACLDATREAIASAAAFARDAPQRVLLRPQALTASLPEPSGCLQDERLRSGGPPVPAAAQPQVASVRRTLVRAHILHELQDFEAASEALDDAELQLRSLDYAPLRAQLDRQRGSLALSELDYPEAQLRLEAAFDSANALGMVELACEAALDLALLFGSEAGVPADNAERWLHHAAALSERGGDELSLRLSTTRAAVAQGTAWIDGWLSRHGFVRIDIRG